MSALGRICFSVILLLNSLPLSAQSLVSIENGKNYDPLQVSSFLHKLQKTNDYVISFRTRLSDKNDEKSNYFILANNRGLLSAYKYLSQASEPEKISLSGESLELIWKTFIQNELFKIQDEKDIPNFCLEKYQVYDSYTYEFVILSRDKMKKLSYYNPEYYDIACYGMEERKKIINSVSVINYVQNK